MTPPDCLKERRVRESRRSGAPGVRPALSLLLSLLLAGGWARDHGSAAQPPGPRPEFRDPREPGGEVARKPAQARASEEAEQGEEGSPTA
jgi:hypothetical protein